MTTDSTRKRRLAIFGGIVLVAIVAVAVVIGLSSGGSDSETTSSSTSPATAAEDSSGLEGTSEIASMLEGIPQEGNTLGAASAPATMMIFADLQCPFCAQFENGALPSIIDKYVRPGKLKLVFQPIVIVGQDSVLGARASAAAAQQNKMYDFNAVLYRNQGEENSGYLNTDYVKKIAGGAGVDGAKLVANLNAGPVEKILSEAQSTATSAKVSSTPSFFIAKKGQPLKALQVTSLEPSAFYGKLDQVTG